MNINDLSTQLLYTTVPLWTEASAGTEVTAGTAFIYSVTVPDKPKETIPLLVTNKHVVQGAKRGLIEFVGRDGEQPAKGKKIRAEIDGSLLTSNVSPDLDIAIVPIGAMLNQLQASGRLPFFRTVGPELIPSASVMDELAAIEDIIFIGYPSGLRDEKNSTPLIRRGITATPAWNNFQGEPCFLIDAGVFPGSSGSPVFILNQGAYPTKSGLAVGSRLLFLGVIFQTLSRSTPDDKAYLGLGKVLRSDSLRDFIGSAIGPLVPRPDAEPQV